MRVEFKNGTPIEDQIKRRIKVKTGHKHQARPGPGKAQREGKAKWQAQKVAKDRLRRKKVAAYWAGEREEFPK